MEFAIILFCVIIILCFIASEDSEKRRARCKQEQERGESEDKLLLDLAKNPIKPCRSRYSVQQGEKCYLNAEVVVLETRRVRTGTAFAGPTLSIPIAKSLGLRFRAGYLAHAPTVVDQLTPIQLGTIVVTDRTISTYGSSVSRTVRMQDIVGVEICKPSRSLHLDTPYLIVLTRRKGKAWYVAMEHPAYLMNLLARFARHAFPQVEDDGQATAFLPDKNRSTDS